MKKIGIVTVSRADYGIFLPILKEIKRSKELNLLLIVSGSHLSNAFGLTKKEIEKDGFEISYEVQMLLNSDDRTSISASMGLGIIGFSKSFDILKPDLLLLLGDRFETLSAAVAAIPFNVPICHIHGGEETEGAFDNVIRHSITKLSHLHFVSNNEYAKRLIKMGENNERIYVVGAPSLDNLRGIKLLNKKELEREIDFPLDPAPLLITFHPITLEVEKTKYYIKELLKAIYKLKYPVIFTMPNADTYNSIIRNEILNFSEIYKKCKVFESLGTKIYFSLMKYSAAMVGNSSSGIIEAPSFKLPVVNVGTRQKGRVKAKNVIDSGYSSKEIIDSIKRAVSQEFRNIIKKVKNPYGEGRSAEKIVKVLKSIKINKDLLIKNY